MRAIVVGAGHNGLISACYLARAGVEVTVFERRGVLGGAVVTEEVHPGYKVSTASYSFGLFRPDIFADLDLASHGLSFYPKEPQMFVPLRDGRSFFIWRDEAASIDEISKIHRPDADAYRRWNRFWEEAINLLRPLAESQDPPALREVERQLPEDVWRLAVAGSVEETVKEFFDSPEMQGAFASQGIIGTARSCSDPGTAWVMAYHYLGGELNGSTGTWAYVRGGMGSVTKAIASHALAAGVKLELEAEVEQVIVEGGVARGVRTADREEFADLILVNADPVRLYKTLLAETDLPEAISKKVATWQTPGSVVKVNLALKELPDFLSRPGLDGPQHRGTIEISPSIDYLVAAFEDSRSERGYSQRPFMEVFIQSATDPTLAPQGRHALSAFCQYAAPDLTKDKWESMREDVEHTVIGTIAEYAPNIESAIIASQVLGPPDLEEIFGLTGGNIFHGEITPDQCFGDRFGYRTPFERLYLCGSGAPPGGGVMGAPVRNAARVAMEDLSL